MERRQPFTAQRGLLYNALWATPLPTMTLPTESIELGLERFAALIGEHSQLREELGASGRDFFGGEPPRHNAPEALLAGEDEAWPVLEPGWKERLLSWVTRGRS